MAGRFNTHSVTAVTDASGDVTAYLGDVGGGAATEKGRENGEICSIAYTKTDYAAGVDFTITTEAGGLTVWAELNVDASKTVYPLAAAAATDGTAMLFAAAGEAVPAGRIPLIDDRVKIVIANGGNTKTGAFSMAVRR